MGFGLPDNKINVDYNTPNAAGIMLNTLDQLNKVRASYLANQASEATLPYAGPQAEATLRQTRAKTGLIGQQANYFPMTATSALLGNAAKAGVAFNPLAALKYADPNTRAQASNAMINGAQGLGNVRFNNDNYQAIGSLVNNLLTKFGGGGIGNQLGNNPMRGAAPNLIPASDQMPDQSLSSLKSTYDSDPKISAMTNALNSSSGIAPQNQNSGYSTPDQLSQYNDQQKAATQMGAVGSKANSNYGYVKNALTSISKIDPSEFARYMGLKGHVNLLLDKANSAISNDPNSTYNKYLAYQNNIPFINDQIAKYNQSSISPHAAELREAMLNPVTMTSNVPAAMLQIRRLRQLMTQEGGTWAQQAGKSKEYEQFKIPEDGSDILQEMQKIKASGENPRNYLAALDPMEQKLAIAAWKKKNG